MEDTDASFLPFLLSRIGLAKTYQYIHTQKPRHLVRGGRRQGWGIIENENLQGTQTGLLTYVETEGCQDGRDGRERGVDEHAPLVLSIHIHDFFLLWVVVEKMYPLHHVRTQEAQTFRLYKCGSCQ